MQGPPLPPLAPTSSCQTAGPPPLPPLPRPPHNLDTPLSTKQDLDGVVLTIDPAHPEQERELETFYRNFAEPNNLYTRQCMVVAIQVQREGSGLGGWSGAFCYRGWLRLRFAVP